MPGRSPLCSSRSRFRSPRSRRWAAGLCALPLAPRPPDGAVGAAREGLGAQLSAGLRFLRADADAGLLVLVVGGMVVFANMAVVAEVAFAESVLGAGPTGYSVLVA